HTPGDGGVTSASMLEAARRHAEAFTPARGAGARVAVVACMDRRLDVMSLFGLRAGEAYVIRNAGGLVTEDVRRSLAVAQHALGVEEVLLVRHTDCGMHGLDDEALLSALTEATGQRPTWRPGGFADLEEDLRRALASLARDPHVPAGATARGFVYDVVDGSLTEVRAGQ
ncbi:carbonic anhydrase, partial [Actinomyces sp. 217892]